jgi:hypothetical protein
MGNKQFLKGFFSVFGACIVICVGMWYFFENVDYVETSISSLDYKAGTVEVTAILHIDDDPVIGFSKTADYCDRKIAKKEMKQKAKAALKEFKRKCN